MVMMVAMANGDDVHFEPEPAIHYDNQRDYDGDYFYDDDVIDDIYILW